MADDLTVLLVGGDAAPYGLSEQLESQQIYAEPCSPGELQNMLQLAEPTLVVQFGKKGAKDTVSVLQGASTPRPVRLVIVAEREDLPELRLLDRTVVISLLATDLPPKVIAARVSMLSRKAIDQRGAALEKNVPPPLAHTTHQPTLAGLGPKPSEDSRLIALPASPVPSVQASPQTAVRGALSNVAGLAPSARGNAPVGDAPVGDARAGDAPAVAAAAPTPATGRLRVAIADGDVTRADLVACSLREQGMAVRLVPPDPQATAHWQSVRDFRPDVLLVDASAIQSQEAGRTELFAHEWLEQVRRVSIPFQALFDEKLGTVRLQVLLAHVFGSANVGPLARSAPAGATVPEMGSVATRNESTSAASDEDDERETTMFGDERLTMPVDETALIELEDDERPTMARGPVASEGKSQNTFDLPTDAVHRELTILALEETPGVEPESLTSPPLDLTEAAAPAPAKAAPAISQPDHDLQPPDSQSGPQNQTGRLPTGNNEDSQTAAPVVQSSSGHQGPSSSRWVAAAGLLVGLGIVGWLVLVETRTDPGDKQRAASPTPGEAVAEAERPGSSIQETSSPNAVPERASDARATGGPDASSPTELNDGDPPYRVRAAEPVPDCSELVKDLATLQAGGVAQANQSWDRARQALVQGDLDMALQRTCEAALIHPKSLAVESLAGLYLTKHAPEKAMVWLKKALEVRPDRRKTKELLADVLGQLGDVEQARRVFAEAVHVHADNQKTLDLLAEQYGGDAERRLQAGDVAGAELLFRRAAMLDPKSARAAAGVARVLMERKDEKGASAWAERALSLRAEDSQALSVLGDLALHEGDEAKALELYRRAVSSDPRNGRAHTQIYKLEHR